MKTPVPRFRLSTILLAFVVIALSAGWFVDRRINLQKQIDHVEREWYGRTRFQECWETILTARANRDGDALEFQTYLNYELYWSIFTAWRYQADIDFAIEDECSSLCLANETMTILECDSHSEFIDFASELFPKTDQYAYPEVFDAKSEDYASLKDFLERAIEPQNAIAWGQ